MSISRARLHNIVKRVIAAKSDVELSPKEKGEGDNPQEITEFQKSPPPAGDLQVIGKIYFFSAPPTEDIPFGNLYSILSGEAPGVSDEDKAALYNKLKGGSAPYSGDYFKWVGLAILAQQGTDETRKVAYLYLTEPWGGLDTTRTYMNKTDQPDFDPPNPESAAKQLNLFESVQPLNNIIDISTGPGVFFSRSMPNENDTKRMLKESLQTVAGSVTDSGDFEKNGVMYEGYRMRATTIPGTPLRNIDGTISNEDEIGPNKKGYYPGGEKAFRELMEVSKYSPEKETEEKPKEKGAPQESLGEKVEEKEESRFRPVDEVTPTTKRKVNEMTTQASDKESKIIEINEDDPRANYYTGDWSIMRDLVRRQHKKMKIRKEAQGNIDLNVPATPEDTQEVGEALKNISKSLKEVQKATKSTGIKINTTPGMSSSASVVDNVVSKFLK